MMADIDDRTRGKKRRFPPDDRAITDEDVKVIVLAAKGPGFSGGHGPARGQCARGAARSQIGRLLERSRRLGRHRGLPRPREGDLRQLLPPLARTVQTDHRLGAGQGHRRRADADLPCDPVIASEDATFQDNTPSEFENELKFSPYISDAMVIGSRSPEPGARRCAFPHQSPDQHGQRIAQDTAYRAAKHAIIGPTKTVAANMRVSRFASTRSARSAPPRH